MYGRQLGAPEQYFGPARPGQSNAQYQEQMLSPVVAVGGIAAAAMMHPVLGVAALIGWAVMGSGRDHSSKPRQQGG